MREPANDAHLIQLVRTALGKEGRGVNVSSCGFVVTLHGVVESEAFREEIEASVRSVGGVEEVVCKLREAGRIPESEPPRPRAGGRGRTL